MSALAPLPLAVLQTATHWHNPQRNHELFEQLLDQVPQGTALAVLPEMFSTGFTMSSQQVAEDMAGPTVQWLCQQADQRQLVICGSVVIQDGQQFFNRLLWATPDGGLSWYDKRHCFRMAGEHEHYSAGQQRVVVELAGWRICLSVCYDLRFPVWLRNCNDYDVLLCVANWPAARRDAWMTLLKARAIENQAYCVGVNIVGTDGNDVQYSGVLNGTPFVENVRGFLKIVR